MTEDHSCKARLDVEELIARIFVLLAPPRRFFDTLHPAGEKALQRSSNRGFL
jgi:hypothetical protein